jgi:F-type H+-transporting ATPase subunit delta
MIEGSVARRYTRALFSLAREAGREEQVGQEIEQFYAAYNGSELHAALENPAFPVASRKRVLIQVGNRQGLSPLSLHFLSLLLERDRLIHLPGIVSCYRRLLNEAQGRVEAKAIGASPLAAGQLEELTGALEAISGKDVVLHQESDRALIGGLVVELEGKIYDGSIRTQLENMKRRIARGY